MKHKTLTSSQKLDTLDWIMFLIIVKAFWSKGLRLKIENSDWNQSLFTKSFIHFFNKKIIDLKLIDLKFY